MSTQTDRSIARSMELYKRASELIPGATQLISRRPSRYAYGVSPVFAASAKGARVIDVDGNEYIDWVSGIGAIILGYADPVVDEAVREQQAKGSVYSITAEVEVELAEELVAAVPCAEMVRFAKGGGDACAIAIRIARGVTGRDKVLFCGYHGWHDWYLAANLSEGNLDSHLFPGIEPIGVPKCLEGSAIPFPFGDLNALGELLDRHRGEIGAIMMEPLRSELPPEGYLDGVRKLATEHGVILIYDEVSTGIRFSPGGVQPVVGGDPDMSVFAKSLSNGYAIGAVVGRRDVMEPAAQMFISSTYWGETLGLRAALTTLQEVRKRNVPEYLDKLGSELKSRLNAVAEETGAPISCTGINVHPYLNFEVDDSSLKKKLGTLYVQEMAKRGCHGYPSFYMNAAQGPAEIEQTTDAARETFGLIADGIESSRIDDLIECEIREEPFKRLVT